GGISISTENAAAGSGPFVHITDNFIHDGNGWGIRATAGSTTPSVHVLGERNIMAGNFDGGVFWQGSNLSNLHLENDVLMQGTLGLSVPSGGTNVELSNVTFRRNTRDISTFGAISLDSTIVEDCTAVRGQASSRITFSRGPVMDPSVPDGCSDFQTDDDPGFPTPIPDPSVH